MVPSSIKSPSSSTSPDNRTQFREGSNNVTNTIPIELIRNRLPPSQSSCTTQLKKTYNPYFAFFNNNFTEDELLEKVEEVFLSSPNLKDSVEHLYQLITCIKKYSIREKIIKMPRLLKSIHEHGIVVLSKIKFDEAPTEFFSEINFCLKNSIRCETNENRKELKDIINNYLDYCSRNIKSCNQIGFFESFFYIIKYSSESVDFIFNNIIKNLDVQKMNKEQLLLLLSIISFINIFNDSSINYLRIVCFKINEKLYQIKFNDVLFLLKRNEVKNKFCLDNGLYDFYNNDVVDCVENCFRYYMEKTIFRDHSFFLKLNDINYVVCSLNYIETSLNSCSFVNEKIYSKQKVIFYLKLLSKHINSYVDLSCDSLEIIHNHFLNFINDGKVDVGFKEDLKQELIEIDLDCLSVLSNYKKEELSWWKKEIAMKIIATRLHIFYYLSLLKTGGGQAVLSEVIDDLILFTEKSSKSLLIHFVARAKLIITSFPKYQDFWEYFYLIFKDQNFYLNNDEDKRKVECSHYKEILLYCQKNLLDGFLRDNFIHVLPEEAHRNGLKLIASLFLIYHTIHQENEFLDSASSEELCSLVDYLKKFTEDYPPSSLNDFLEMINRIDISGEHYRSLRDYLNGEEAVLEESSDSNKKSFEIVDFESTNEMIEEVEDFNDRDLEVDSALTVSRQCLSSVVREFLYQSVDEFLDEIVKNIQEQRGKFLIPTELAQKIQNRAKKLFEDKSDSFVSIPFKMDLSSALSQALEVFLTPTASMPHKGVKRLSKSVPEEVLKAFVYGKVKETLWEVSGLVEHFDLKEKKMPVKAYYWKNNTEPFCYECSGYFDKEGRLVRLASTGKVRKYPVKDVQQFVSECHRKLKGRIISNEENTDSLFILLYPKFTNRSIRKESLNSLLKTPKALTSSTSRITSSAKNWSQESSKGASTILTKRLHQQVIDSTGSVVVSYPEPPNKKRSSFQAAFEPLLKPYQSMSVKKVLDGWSDGKRGMILADKMGLGKTIELTKIIFQLFHKNPQGTYVCVSTVSTYEQLATQVKKFFIDFEIDELHQLIEDTCGVLSKSLQEVEKDHSELVKLENCLQKVKKLKKSHEDVLKDIKNQCVNLTKRKNPKDINRFNWQKRTLQLKKDLQEERIERLKEFENRINDFAKIAKIQINSLRSEQKVQILNHKEIFFQSKREPESSDLLKGKIVIVTESKLKKLAPVLKTCKELFLAVDEAHRTFNLEGQLAQAVQQTNPAFLLLVTGTPFQNRFQELLMLLQHIKLVDQGVIFALEKILTCCTNRLANFIIEPPADENALQELFELIGKGFTHFELACEHVKTVLVRHTRKEARRDWKGMLPTKQEVTIQCSLTEEVSAEILKADQEFFNYSGGEGEVEKKFFSHYHMISRAIIHPDFIDHKAETAMVLLNEIFNKGSEAFLEWIRKSEVLTRFIDGEELKGFIQRCESTLMYADQEVVLQLLHKAIQVKFNLDIPIFNGTLSKNQRSEIIDKFKKNFNQPNLMLISCKAGGVGLDISSKNIVLFEQMFGLEKEQVIGRSIRAGYNEEVMVYKVEAGTMTENHLKFLHKRKKNIAKYWLDMKERSLGERFELFLKMIYEGLSFFAQRQLSEGSYPEARSHLIESLCAMIETKSEWYYEELNKIRNAAFSQG